MLSRVAERLYWFGRYLERTENTARLISVYSNLVLDLPKVGFVWESLVNITGFDAQFKQRFVNNTIPFFRLLYERMEILVLFLNTHILTDIHTDYLLVAI